MSPLYSTEKLSGTATQLTSAGVLVPFVGNAVLWIGDPTGVVSGNTVACAAPNGAWIYLNANTKTGTWTWSLHVPAGTGTLPSATADTTWEVDASIATSQ